MFCDQLLDRINIGFAALSMNKDLHLTRLLFGFVGTTFYVGYVLCEVPSNLAYGPLWRSRLAIANYESLGGLLRRRRCWSLIRRV